MPKVSVIVPVYNVEKYIGRCIESIQKQTLTDWELILIDDCSPDNSIDIIQEYAKEDSRIIVERHDVNHGPMIARRWGDEIASGGYITYCDGDDMLPYNALEILYNAARETEADIVSGNMIYVSTTGTQKKIENSLKYGNDKMGAFKSLLRGEQRHVLCSKLFKASILKKNTYKTYDYFINSEDMCLLYQVVDNVNKIVQIDNSVYYYMQNMESSTHSRLTEKKIMNVCKAINIVNLIITQYVDLNKEKECFLTNRIYSWYAKGYDLDANLKKHLNENKLSKYISLHYLLKNCKIKIIIIYMYWRLKNLIKWYVLKTL